MAEASADEAKVLIFPVYEMCIMVCCDTIVTAGRILTVLSSLNSFQEQKIPACELCLCFLLRLLF